MVHAILMIQSPFCHQSRDVTDDSQIRISTDVGMNAIEYNTICDMSRLVVHLRLISPSRRAFTVAFDKQGKQAEHHRHTFDRRPKDLPVFTAVFSTIVAVTRTI